jgi:hypothetical protein
MDFSRAEEARLDELERIRELDRWKRYESVVRMDREPDLVPDDTWPWAEWARLLVAAALVGLILWVLWKWCL